MFDFPATPTQGQTYTAAGITWQYNGYGWVMQSGNVGPTGPEGPTGPQGVPGEPGPTGGVTIEVADTAPALPADNSLWFKSNAGALWLRYRDADGVQWLQVNSNLILPPQDGNEYVMVNGLWRLKQQTLVMDGLSAVNVPVPVGARLFKLDGVVITPTATNTSLCCRVSLDGLNFMQAANDYSHSGFIHYTGQSPAAVAALSGAYTQIYMTYNGTNANLPHVFRALMGINRPGAGASQRWDMNCVGSCYGAVGWQTNVNRIETMETNAGSNIAIKAVQVLAAPAVACGPNSYVDVEWVY